MTKPKKWTEIYPVGTNEGDEESKFFKALARRKEYQWRSTAAIAKESGLSKQRVEEIVNKYLKKGVVFQSPKREDHWGYWERVPEMLNQDKKSIAQTDKDARVKKAMRSEVTKQRKRNWSDEYSSWYKKSLPDQINQTIIQSFPTPTGSCR
jgi:hypothetical protein